MNQRSAHDRLLTVPNVLSGIRLALIPVFIYLLLVAHADAWAVAILMFTGASDWADGKIARLLNQSSRLGEYLDPAVDRLYMVTIPIVFGLRGIVPWWIIAVLLARDVLLAAELPLLRTRGITALPVVYVGKAATFSLMSAFPRLGVFDLGPVHVPVVVRGVRGAGGIGATPDAAGESPRKPLADKGGRRWLTRRSAGTTPTRASAHTTRGDRS